jgi:hypothetical protein
VLGTPILATPTHPLPQPPQVPPQKALKNSESFGFKRGEKIEPEFKNFLFQLFQNPQNRFS